jgi:Holliday junction DNA helicase RuvA
MFLTFRDCVPATGAKKALEYLDKASRSLPDFRRAVLEKDAKVLSGVFGFTRKTADKLIDGLKEAIAALNLPGEERLVRAGGPAMAPAAMSQALTALGALGYKAAEARAALSAVAEEHAGETLDAERIIRLALKRL